MSRWPSSITTIEQRIEARTVHMESGCWIWQGSTNNAGYGQMRTLGGGPNALVHRLSYEAYRGPIPADLTIDHLCRHTLCVNPDHLEPVTKTENIQRAAAVRTHCKQGHLLVDSNLIKSARYRACRECNNARMRAHRKSQSAPRKA